MKRTLIYDGTFDGFLTSVYEVFEEQLDDVEIVKPKHFNPNIFVQSDEIVTDLKKANRVWHGIQMKITKSGANRLYACFLSEIKGVENVLMRYILHAFCKESFNHTDYSNVDVSRVLQVSKMVFKERDRMEAIVRFQLTKDGIYFATIEPEFNALPLLLKRFKSKFPDREWILYDKRRKNGVHCKRGIIRWITNQEFYSLASRLTKKNKVNSMILDSNHIRIREDDQLKSAI